MRLAQSVVLLSDKSHRAALSMSGIKPRGETRCQST
jgi:hypothetical protein